MSFSPMPTEAATTATTEAYRLRQPGLSDARAALQRLYAHQNDTIWPALLSRAGLTGAETDDASLQRLLSAMAHTDPVMALCARSLTIRAIAYTHLAAAHTLIRDAE